MNDDLIRRGELLKNAEALIKIARVIAGNDKVCNKAVDLMQQIVDLAQVMPAVDAVEVVRCKDCEYADHCEEEGEPVRLVCPMWGANCDENEFCSRGERREDDGEIQKETR